MSSKTINRQDALWILAQAMAKTASPEDRSMAVYELTSNYFSGLEDDEDSPDAADLFYQSKVTESIRRRIDAMDYAVEPGDEPDVSDPLLDVAIAVTIFHEKTAYSNDYVLRALAASGYTYEKITGPKPDFIACPCCGAATLSSRADFEICQVCWWEDDGTDNNEASLYFSGPNKGLQLTAARILYLLTGIYNPDRKDLMAIAEPMERFIQKRIFGIDKTKGFIIEKGTDWYAPLKPPHLKPGEKSPTVSLFGAGARDFPSQDVLAELLQKPKP